MMMDETNRFLNSPKADRKQIKASPSTIRLESKNTGTLVQMEFWASPRSQQVRMKSDTLPLGCCEKPPHNVTKRDLVTVSLLSSQPIPKSSSDGIQWPLFKMSSK